MPPLPFSCAMRCPSNCRQRFTASSSRQTDSDSILPLSVKLSNRSIEINPSIFSSAGRKPAARSRYSCFRPGAGTTSKMTAITRPSYSPKSKRARSRARLSSCVAAALAFITHHRTFPSSNAKVLELPRIGLVPLLLEQPAAVLQRRPVGIFTDDVAQIGIGEIEDAAEVDLVRIGDARRRILHSPHDATHYPRRDLEAGRVLERGELARLLDGKLGAEPVSALGMPHEERAQLVHAFVDFVHQDPVLGLRLPVLAGDLVV